MFSSLPKDRTLEREDRWKIKKKYSPLDPHLLQAQQALALLYAKVAGRHCTGSYPAPSPSCNKMVFICCFFSDFSWTRISWTRYRVTDYFTIHFPVQCHGLLTCHLYGPDVDQNTDHLIIFMDCSQINMSRTRSQTNYELPFLTWRAQN